MNEKQIIEDVISSVMEQAEVIGLCNSCHDNAEAYPIIDEKVSKEIVSNALKRLSKDKPHNNSLLRELGLK